jgi:hypothetical protein
MFNKPINNILKPQFEFFYSEAVKSAREDFKINISDKIESLEHIEKWNVIISENGKINDLIAQNEHPYYVRDHIEKDWLLAQYSSRHFLLNIDESVEFKEAVYLGEFNHLIGEKIDELSWQIPYFSFNEFLSGKECKYLNLDNIMYHIREDEYVKIIDWRSKKIVNIVSFELELLVKNYQEHCSKLDHPLDFINKQLQVIEDELVETVNGAKELKTTFSKLFVFKDVDLERYNDELLMFNYPTFFDDRTEFKFISPVTIKQVLVELRNKPIKLFSNEYVLFYTLSALSCWLKSIIKGKPIQEIFKYSVSLNLLDQNCNEAEVELRTIKENINVFACNPAKSKKDIEVYLKNELEQQIITYNNTGNKIFYYLLGKGDKSELISDFKINILFNNNQEDYLKKLKEVYILIGVSNEVSDLYKDIFDTKCVYSSSVAASYLVLRTLINKMVLNKSIFHEIESVKGVFWDKFCDYLPVDFTFYNILQKNISLFEESTKRLVDILDCADPNIKVLYIQTRLKELKQSEFMLRASNEKDVSFNEDEYKYENLFKELLSIEADFIRETAQISPLPFLPAQKKPFFELKEVNSFENFISEEKQVYILKLLEDLSITLDGMYNLTERKKSALRGVVEALRYCNFLPNIGIDKLCAIIAAQINLELKSKLNYSETSKKFKKDAKQYILDYPFH